VSYDGLKILIKRTKPREYQKVEFSTQKFNSTKMLTKAYISRMKIPIKIPQNPMVMSKR
jgi:hypothetical protein